jgi:hypothetical protein
VIDLLAYLPAKRKKTASGWISVNAPCCVNNGESADRRQRGGIKITDQGWSWHCFNCGFTASFIMGRNLSFKARRLLSWLNVPSEEIERVNLESLRHRSVQGILDDRQRVVHAIESIQFEDRELPEGFIIVDQHTPVHWQYIQDRCLPLDYPMGMNGGEPNAKWTPRSGLIVPFTYDGRIVGHTTRYLDDKAPRYIHDIQPGYVFGTDLQRANWQHALVMEGVFDALSISGLAVLHAEISDSQARLIRSLGREVPVVPDQDAAGIKLVDRAVELGWAVSVPEWPNPIKDVNDAVRCYGKLATLMTILQARETSRIKIEIKRKWLQKKIKQSV